MENKVQCIESGWVGLSKGTTYNVYQVDSTVDLVLIENDNGEVTWYDFKAFNFFPEVLTSVACKESKEKREIAYKDFLSSMPASARACVMIGAEGQTVSAYNMEFDCDTEERLQEVFSALIVLFKEDV